jgi:hypothetical protein
MRALSARPSSGLWTRSEQHLLLRCSVDRRALREGLSGRLAPICNPLYNRVAVFLNEWEKMFSKVLAPSQQGNRKESR